MGLYEFQEKKGVFQIFGWMKSNILSENRRFLLAFEQFFEWETFDIRVQANLIVKAKKFN